MLGACLTTHWVGEESPTPAADSEQVPPGPPPPCLVPDHVDLAGEGTHFYVPEPSWALAGVAASVAWEAQRDGGTDVALDAAAWFGLSISAGGLDCGNVGADAEHGASWSGGGQERCGGLDWQRHGATLCALYPLRWACEEGAWDDLLDDNGGRRSWPREVVLTAWYLAGAMPLLWQELEDDERRAIQGDSAEAAAAGVALLLAGPDGRASAGLLRCSWSGGDGEVCEGCSPALVETVTAAAAHAQLLREGAVGGACYSDALTPGVAAGFAGEFASAFPGVDAGTVRDAARDSVQGLSDRGFDAAASEVVRAVLEAMPAPLRCPGDTLASSFGGSCPDREGR